MDRKYKAPDKVRVYTSSAARASGAEPVAIKDLVPFSQYGLDYYQFGGKMYEGFQDRVSGEVYIFADRPLHGMVAHA